MTARRVAVTGVGVVSALGATFAEFWKALLRGESGIRPMTLVPPGSLRFPNAAEVRGFETSRYFDDKEAALVDRFTQFGAVAAREALQAAQVRLDLEHTA